MRLDLFAQDARRIRRLAEEVVQQVGFYERNIATGDEAETVRFLIMQTLAERLLRAAARGANRYEKERGP